MYGCRAAISESTRESAFELTRTTPNFGIGRYEFMARLPDKWIGSAFGSDLSRRSVAGEHGDVVADGK